MNAHPHIARRGPDPRIRSMAPEHGRASGERVPRLGASRHEGREGTQRGRTPSPVPPSPSVPGAAPSAARRIDPRWYQIAMLSALLGYGVLGLGFGLSVPRIVATIAAALATQ